MTDKEMAEHIHASIDRVAEAACVPRIVAKQVWLASYMDILWEAYWEVNYPKLLEMMEHAVAIAGDSVLKFEDGGIGVELIEQTALDYFHKLPPNKHPWERDGIADME